MATLAISEDPGEMLQNVAFHQSALFAKINQSSEIELHFFSSIITCDSQYNTIV